MAKPTPSGGIRPFIEKGNRRDLLLDLSNAPVLDLDTAIDKLISRASDDSDRPKKDGKDGTADGLIGAGKTKDVMEGDDSGKEATDSTGKEATDSTGKESTDSTGKESTDSTGKESTDSTGKESTDSTGKESTDSTGKESSDSTGKEATDGTGKEATDSTGKEATDSTGKEATDGTGKEATDGTGKEATDSTGKEATDSTGKEATDGTGKEATDGTGKEATDNTGKETNDDTGKEASDDPGKQFKESADDSVRDLRKWHADVVNAHDTVNSVLNGYFGKHRDTTVEAPSEVDVSNFTVGNNANDISRNEVGPPGNLDSDKLKEVQREHDARLDDLIRPDRPII